MSTEHPGSPRQIQPRRTAWAPAWKRFAALSRRNNTWLRRRTVRGETFSSRAITTSFAPAGKHVLWAYTHVPAGSTLDATELVTREVERFAPGFRDLVLASASRSAVEIGAQNANYVGGDIYAGELSMRQFVKRPVVSTKPWRTPLEGVYLCSSATPTPARGRGIRARTARPRA